MVFGRGDIAVGEDVEWLGRNIAKSTVNRRGRPTAGVVNRNSSCTECCLVRWTELNQTSRIVAAHHRMRKRKTCPVVATSKSLVGPMARSNVTVAAAGEGKTQSPEDLGCPR